MGKQDRTIKEQTQSLKQARKGNKQLQKHFGDSLEKLNFFRKHMDKSLDKDKEILDSILTIKNGQESLSNLFKHVKKVGAGKCSIWDSRKLK